MVVITNNNTELLDTTITSSSQRDVPYQVSALQVPITLSSAQTPSVYPKACIRNEMHIQYVDIKQVKLANKKKPGNYCEKCDLFVCKDCFEKFHTRSKI